MALLTKLAVLLHLDIVRDYNGTGWMVFLFLAAFIYLLITEKKKQFRVILVWGTMVMIILFCFPLTKMIFSKATNGDTYYRFLWMIPMGITIAYAAARMFLDHRIIGILLTGALVVLCGDYVYDGQYMYAAENEYHLPQEMMEICDMIHPDKYFTIACFPAEYVHQVRQYDSNIELAFSREEIVSVWTLGSRIYEESQKEVVDVKALTDACVEGQVEYYIFGKSRQRDGDFEEYGWELFGETQNYCIYKSTAIGSVWERAVDWLSGLSEQERLDWLASQNMTVEDYETQLEWNRNH